jgi:hypothetical protein
MAQSQPPRLHFTLACLTLPKFTHSLSVPAKVTLDVAAVAQLPNITVFDVDIDLAENFFGPLRVTLSVVNGSLDVARGAPVAGVTLVAGALQRSTSFTIAGMPAALNQALAATYYVAPWYQCTTDVISIALDDQGFFGAGGPLQDSASISVTVTC